MGRDDPRAKQGSCLSPPPRQTLYGYATLRQAHECVAERECVGLRNQGAPADGRSYRWCATERGAICAVLTTLVISGQQEDQSSVTKMQWRRRSLTALLRWPLPVVSSTRMTSPAPMMRASPSLAVICTPLTRLMIYCRRGAVCQSRS